MAPRSSSEECKGNFKVRRDLGGEMGLEVAVGTKSLGDKTATI